MTLRIACVVCARDEARFLKTLVPYLLDQDIDVVLIDNDSTDGTREWLQASPYAGRVQVRPLPFEGTFDLTAQLALKAEALSESTADWVIHQDADEILQGPKAWGSLRSTIEEADAQGFNVLSFDELVLLPLDPEVDDPYVNNRLCYFFEPRPLRLMRAWKRAAGLSNERTGGHILTGPDVYVSPIRPLLKHFMVRSQAHARQKYLGRRFSDRDLAKGWHGNRLGLTEEMLRLPADDPRLTLLASPQASPEPMPDPIDRHFWDWGCAS